MSRLTWSATGERFYETGVDRGVLYVGNQPGVAWTGLISINENVTGGTAKPYYLDGLKYLNMSTAEEYAATLAAFSSPPEFGPCDGSVAVQNGLYVTQQKRVPFNFSYRTKIGNDVDGDNNGYKIHVVYNALAAPSQRTRKTQTTSASADTMSWSVTTKSPFISGYRPTAHFVIDSRYTIPFRLKSIEDVLYGNDISAASLPAPQDFVNLFSPMAYPPLKAVLVKTNVYEIHEVDPVNARAVMQPVHPQPPAVGEDPILWLDTSAGNYAIPRIITGG
jgi:hypothetical protein